MFRLEHLNAFKVSLEHTRSQANEDAKHPCISIPAASLTFIYLTDTFPVCEHRPGQSPASSRDRFAVKYTYSFNSLRFFHSQNISSYPACTSGNSYARPVGEYTRE
jgi:hypothetical protein